MEFINYTRRDVGSSGTASTDIKNVKSIASLKLNLENEKKDITFSGLGSYLEVDIRHKGTSKKVKIPFFSTYKKDKFVNIDGFAFMNPLAKKIIEKVIKRSVPTFDLADFQAAATAELNARISSLGTTPLDLNEKARLENRRDNIIATAIKKDSSKLVREEIDYLEDAIKKGVNLRACSNDTTRKAAMTNYCNQFERLVTLKNQSKKMTWSQKKGLSKLNNKHFKRVTAALAALAVAAGLVVGRVIDFPKQSWEKVENWFKKPKATVTQMVTPTPIATLSATTTPRVTAIPVKTQNVTAAPTRTPNITATPNVTAAPIITTSSNKQSLNSEMVMVAASANIDNFANYRAITDYYGVNYESLINSYTIIEHIHEIDTSRMSISEIEEHINNTRTLVSLVIASRAYQTLPLRAETFETMQSCLNGNPDVGIRFVREAQEAKEPLLDMLAIGELESNIIFDQQLYDFNVNVYFKEIENYKRNILNGTLEIAHLEPSKVLTLGTYPRA